MANWDWQVFCRDTVTGEQQSGCFGQGGDMTYLDWMLSAWGWTLSVASLSLVVALVVGAHDAHERTHHQRHDQR